MSLFIRQAQSLILCVSQYLLMVCFLFPFSPLRSLEEHPSMELSSFQLQAQRLEQEDLSFKGPKMLWSVL